MVYAYWRDRFNQWHSLGKLNSVEEAQGLLAATVDGQKIKGKHVWQSQEYIKEDNPRSVRAVVTITPFTEAQLAERYPVFTAPLSDIPDGKQRYFLEQLDERQRKELAFAESYAANFAHGTDGHHRLLLIAKLAAILDSTETELDTEKAKAKK